MVVSYALSPLSGGEITLPWTDVTTGEPHLLELDSTHSLIYARDQSGDPWGWVVVVDHTDPQSMSLGTAYGLFPSGAAEVPPRIVAKLAPDGVTIVVAGGRPNDVGWQSHTFTWDLGVGLTDQGLVQHTTSWTLGTEVVMIPVSATRLFATNAFEWGIYAFSGSGVGALVAYGTHDAAAGPWGKADIWRYDNTKFVLWAGLAHTSSLYGTYGTGITVVDITGDVFTVAAEFEFSSLMGGSSPADLPGTYTVYGLRMPTLGNFEGFALNGGSNFFGDAWRVTLQYVGGGSIAGQAYLYQVATGESNAPRIAFQVAGPHIAATAEVLTDFGNVAWVADPAQAFISAGITVDIVASGQATPQRAEFPARVLATPRYVMFVVSTFAPRNFLKVYEVVASGFTGWTVGYLPIGAG